MKTKTTRFPLKVNEIKCLVYNNNNTKKKTRSPETLNNVNNKDNECNATENNKRRGKEQKTDLEYQNKCKGVTNFSRASQ